MIGWQTITPCRGGAYIGRLWVRATPWHLVKLACRLAVVGGYTFRRQRDLVYVFDYVQPPAYISDGIQQLSIAARGDLTLSIRRPLHRFDVMSMAIKPCTLLWVAYRSWRLN